VPSSRSLRAQGQGIGMTGFDPAWAILRVTASLESPHYPEFWLTVY
jgi:hypothetical protein